MWAGAWPYCVGRTSGCTACCCRQENRLLAEITSRTFQGTAEVSVYHWCKYMQRCKCCNYICVCMFQLRVIGLLCLLSSLFLRASASSTSYLRKSVRPSVTRVICIKTVERRITEFSPIDSPRTLVSENPNIVQKFEGGHPQWTRWMRQGAKILQNYALSHYISEAVNIGNRYSRFRICDRISNRK